jgi:hypothetical protein
VRRGFPQGADPPLGAGKCRGVYVELARLGEVRRGRFEAVDVCSMRELGLQVAADDTLVRDQVDVFGKELGRGL